MTSARKEMRTGILLRLVEGRRFTPDSGPVSRRKEVLAQQDLAARRTAELTKAFVDE